MPVGPYLVVPEVSSERREYIPLGYLEPPTLASNRLMLIPDAELFHFAVLQSVMQMAWTRGVCGRLENRYLYSIKIVYNNFPWPDLSDQQRRTLANAGQAILDARSRHSDCNLADLYHQDTMPEDLREAHTANDHVVDEAYCYAGDPSDAARLAFLFELYGKLMGQRAANQTGRTRR